MTEQELYRYMDEIKGADISAMQAARQRQDTLAKPPHSLGALEDISVRLAGITGVVCSRTENFRVLVFAADNGVCREGISCAPQSVTLQQCRNMVRRKTGMSVLAAAFGCSLVVTDVGIDAQGPWEGIVDRKVRRGTRDLAVECAMTEHELLYAIASGMDSVRQAKRDGMDALGIGEMGIGNTTTTSAVLAAMTGLSVEAVTGRGGGLTDSAFAHKKEVIEKALALHRLDSADVLRILQSVGGYDIAAMVGAYLGCARERLPAVVDGFISVVAALCAVRLCPRVRDFLFLSHSSCEVGYQIAVRELELKTYLQLDMRLGEGSGCPLAFQLLRGACAVMNDMATFSEGHINDDYLAELRQADTFASEVQA